MDENRSFRALVVEEEEPGQFSRSLVDRQLDDLPDGEVLVQVRYSSLNYKDALSASGNKGVTRRYPHTPGIDAAGVVESSRSPDFKPGDQVLSTAAGDLGVNTPGGYGQYIRVPAEWLLPLPDGLTLRQSMIYGTARFTAAMNVDRLKRGGVLPGPGPVLVTGATGGVCMLELVFWPWRVYRHNRHWENWPRRKHYPPPVHPRSSTGKPLSNKNGRPLFHNPLGGLGPTGGGGKLSFSLSAHQTRGGSLPTLGKSRVFPETGN